MGWCLKNLLLLICMLSPLAVCYPHRMDHLGLLAQLQACKSVLDLSCDQSMEMEELRRQLSVFVTGNKIYTVGCRITSVMVAQDARKGRRVLDRFGPSGGGNTLRPVCGCVIPVLGKIGRAHV